MIDRNKSGSKIDLEIEFQEIRIGIAFPCKISLRVNTNYSQAQTKPVVFDNENHRALLNTVHKCAMVVYPSKENIMEVLPIIHTESGQKYGGRVNIDIYKSILTCSYSQTVFIEKCPDKTATLSFRFNYSNVHELPVDQASSQNSHNNSISFYASFNQLIEQAQADLEHTRGSNFISRKANPSAMIGPGSSQMKSRLGKTQEIVNTPDDSNKEISEGNGKENKKENALGDSGREGSEKRESTVSNRSKANSVIVVSSPFPSNLELSLNSSPTTDKRPTATNIPSPTSFPLIGIKETPDSQSGRLSKDPITVDSKEPFQKALLDMSSTYKDPHNGSTQELKSLFGPAISKVVATGEHEASDSMEGLREGLRKKSEQIFVFEQERRALMAERAQLKDHVNDLQSKLRKSEQTYKNSFEELTSQNEHLKRKLESNLVKPEDARLQALEAELRETKACVQELESELSVSEDKRTELKKRLYESETSWVTERQALEETIKELEGRLFHIETSEDFLKLQHKDDAKASQEKIRTLQDLIQVEKHRADFLNQKFETHAQAYLALEKNLAAERKKNQVAADENELLRQEAKTVAEENYKLREALAAINERKGADLAQIEEEKQRFMQEIYELKMLIKEIIDEKQQILGSCENELDDHFESHLQSIKQSVNFSDLQDNELRRLGDLVAELKESMKAKEEEFKEHCATIHRLHGQQVEALERETARLLSDLENAKAESERSAENLKAAFARIDELIKSNYDYAQSALQLKEEKERLKEGLEAATKSRAEVDAEKDRFAKEAQSLQEQLEATAKARDDALNDFETQKYENEVLVEEAEEHHRQMNLKEEELLSMQNDFTNTKGLLLALQREVGEHRDEADHWKEIATKLGKDIAVVNTSAAAFKQNQATILSHLQAKLAQLETLNSIAKRGSRVVVDSLKQNSLEDYYSRAKELAWGEAKLSVFDKLVQSHNHRFYEANKLKDDCLQFSEMVFNFKLQSDGLHAQLASQSVLVESAQNSQDHCIADAHLSKIYLSVLDERLKSAQSEFREETAKMRQASESLERQRLADASARKALLQENHLLKEEALSHVEALQAQEKTSDALNEKLSVLEQSIQQKDDLLQRRQLSIDNLTEVLGAKTSELSNAIKGLEEKSQAIEQLRNGQQSLEESNRSFMAQIDELRRHNIELAEQNDSRKSQSAVAETNLQRLEDELAKYRQALNASQKQAQALAGGLRRSLEKLIALEQACSSKSFVSIDALSKIKAKANSCKQALTEYERGKAAEVITLQGKLDKLAIQNELLESSKQALLSELSEASENSKLLEAQLRAVLDGSKTAEETQREITTRLEQDLKMAQATNNELLERLKSSESECESRKALIADLESQLRSSQESTAVLLDGKKGAIESLMKNIADSNVRIKEHETAIAELIAAHSEEKAMLASQVDSLTASCSQLAERVQNLETEKEGLLNQCSAYGVSEQGLKESIAEMKEAQDSLRHECNSKDAVILDLTQAVSAKEYQCSNLEAQLKEQLLGLKAAQAQLDSRNSEVEEINKKEASRDLLVGRLQESKRELEDRLSIRQEELRQAQLSIEKGAEAMEINRVRISELEKNLAEEAGLKDSALSKLAALNGQYEELQASHKQSLQRCEQLQAAIAEAAEEKQRADISISERNQKIQEQISQLKEYERQLLSVNSELASAHQATAILQDTVKEKDALVSNLEIQLREASSQLGEAKEQLDKAQNHADAEITKRDNKVKALEKSIEEAQAAIQSLRHTSTELEAENESLKKACGNYDLQQRHGEAEIMRLRKDCEAVKLDQMSLSKENNELTANLHKTKDKKLALKAELRTLAESLGEKAQALEMSKSENGSLVRNMELLKKDIHALTEKISALEGQESSLRLELSGLKAERDDYLRRVENAQGESKALLSKTHEKEQDKALLRIDFEKLETENKLLKGFIEQKEKEVLALKAEINSLNSNIQTINKQLVEATSDVEAKKAQLTHKSSEEAKSKAKIEKLRSELQDTAGQLQASQSAKIELASGFRDIENELSSVKSTLVLKEKEIEQVRKSLGAEIQSRKNMEKSIENFNSTLQAKEAQLESLRGELKAVDSSKKSLEDSHHRLDEKYKSLVEQFSALKNEAAMVS